MKKRVLAILLVVAMGLSLVACGKGDDKKAEASEGEASNGEGLSVNVILKTTASEYWGYVMAGCQAYGKDHPEVKVDVQGASSETAYDEQLNIIETNLASSQYDGFVIAPLQADMVVKQIAGTKYPIVAVDTAIEAPEVLSFVGTGNETAAYEGGKYAVEMAKAAGWKELEAISISGVEGDSTATARLEGYKKGVNEAGGKFLDAEIQYADAVADKAYSSMEAIIQNHPKGVAMVLCNNDDMAIAAARAAAGNSAYENTIFVGFDGIQSACEAILAKEETMSVAQSAYDMGYKSVEACVKAIKGEEIEAFIDSGSAIITIDNAQEQLDTLKSYLK
ncbi:ABC-type sugar transport system substrate-binding protein [Lachnospiraceae bacterium PF1-21]|uniref:Sugar ABC transporter substrate-binding protein n=1 Tax=Ohessyouella blattaphilus TaxID=2949333 RepID=A0ABT1EFC0_9FIRM|nr:sugar ABC transporter substrate-binding protein [Ohessyouella blattaphilus]MCP1109406.1 sugar ABC transporter substrate-binding protein [Ohessyouella blattaphilus]MCR8562800.1 sugar ABC transporter substrate-binding protein [Ohessyouella blattaphilus]MDL2249289.1 sugar ABC transporter substrate-binding protein [Lachnospiraceae bacterium OttesenSCG-928-J05]